MRYYINGVEATAEDITQLRKDGAVIQWCFAHNNCWFIITNN